MTNRLTVGPSDDNLEGGSPLASIRRLLSNDRGAPEGALVIRHTWRVGAVVGIGVLGRVTFDVQIECFTTIRLVTQRCAVKCVETCQSVESHVLGSTQ